MFADIPNYVWATLTPIAALIGAAVAGLIQQILKERIAMQLRDEKMEAEYRAIEAYKGREKAEKERDRFAATLKDTVPVITEAINQKLAAEGKPPMTTLAAVVPRSNSPTTEEQARAASLQTAEAAIVAGSLVLGLPPREAKPVESDEERAARIARENALPLSPITVIKGD